MILKAKDKNDSGSHVDFFLYENAEPIKYFKVIKDE